MTTAFVIRNQHGQYLTRKGEWVSGRDASVLFHQPHYDQALNQLIETNAKDIHLRGTVVELALDERGRPQVQEYGPDPAQPELLDGESTAAESTGAESTGAESRATEDNPAAGEGGVAA
ncbi:MAG: hypothetical protein CML06_02405 [Pseudomonadales bacterium]|nr:hypothetical protein [Pseudomonadales bacterium]